ncbi:MAG: DNA mismatch repair endonuclease MutL [Thermodesulfobacteriota bacterium]
MGKIRVLSDNLVSKIAAGEIVERPASVVKELVENSIDAGSTRIEIELESGGKRLIRVSDDGEGMTRDDSIMSIERHATSKIKEMRDLFSVSSLGFRGEALPSIANVSRFRMTTRTTDNVIGTIISMEGGILRSVEESGAPQGTTVEVRNLFFNTPPRLKFMKKTETELSNVLDVVEREAISRPGIGFELRTADRVLIRLPARESGPDRIKEIYPGIELYPIEASGAGVRISGFLSGPIDARSTTQKLYSYVNGRAVRDRFLTRILIDSYGRMIEKGRFPQGVLFVEISNADLDVNVHPTKNEVRFGNARIVADLIKDSVTGMLEKAPWLKGYSHAPRDTAYGFHNTRESAASYGGRSFNRSESFPHGNGASPLDRESSTSVTESPGLIQEPHRYSPSPEPVSTDLFGETGRYSGLTVMGQLGDLYIVCAYSGGMILIDQHAAHERINYEKLKGAYTGGKSPDTQELLVPEILDLSPNESDILLRHANDLGALGLGIEAFGNNTFIIRRAPALLNNTELKRLVRDIVSEIKELGAQKSLSEKIDTVIATMACHSSITANYELNREKMKALLSELDRAEFPHSCPHGRPVARELNYAEIERMFKRT